MKRRPRRFASIRQHTRAAAHELRVAAINYVRVSDFERDGVYDAVDLRAAERRLEKAAMRYAGYESRIETGGENGKTV